MTVGIEYNLRCRSIGALLVLSFDSSGVGVGPPHFPIADCIWHACPKMVSAIEVAERQAEPRSVVALGSGNLLPHDPRPIRATTPTLSSSKAMHYV